MRFISDQEYREQEGVPVLELCSVLTGRLYLSVKKWDWSTSFKNSVFVVALFTSKDSADEETFIVRPTIYFLIPVYIHNGKDIINFNF